MPTRRSQNSALNAPAFSDAIPDKISGPSHPLCPLISRKSFTSKGQPARLLGVLGLLAWRGPSTVTRFVVAVVVHSLDRMLGAWSWSHVSVKRRKGFAPFIANSNPSSSVVLVALVLRIAASTLQPLPRLISRRPRAKTVFCALGGTAPARTGPPRFEVLDSDGFAFAAIAQARDKGNTGFAKRSRGSHHLGESGANGHTHAPRGLATCVRRLGFPNCPSDLFEPFTFVAATTVAITSRAWSGGKLVISHCENLRHRFELWLGPCLRRDLMYGPPAL